MNHIVQQLLAGEKRQTGEADMILEAAGWADDATLKAIDAEVKAIVADAAEFARTAPEPDPSELYTDVYTESAA